MADEKAEPKPKLLGVEIAEECPCGAEVKPYDRQMIVWNKLTNLWNRMCIKCINNDAKFVDPKPENNGLNLAYSGTPTAPSPEKALLEPV